MQNDVRETSWKRDFEDRTGDATVALERTCEVDEAASVCRAVVSTVTTHHWDNIISFRYTNIE